MDPTDDYVIANGMSGVQIAESDAVPSVAPVAHQTLCTEDTENDIGPVPVRIRESEAYGEQIVKGNEVPIVQRPEHGVASQHSSGESCKNAYYQRYYISISAIMSCIDNKYV